MYFNSQDNAIFHNLSIDLNNNMHKNRHSNRRNLKSNSREHKKRKEFNHKQRHQIESSSSSSNSLNICKKRSKPEFNDIQLFCDDCQQYYNNICSHHKQIYIPDKKVSISSLQYSQRKSDLTCPEGIIIKPSTIEKAGKGIFATKHFEKNTFFGPYLGIRHSNFTSAQESGYAWSIVDKNGKMIYIIDGYDPKTSNWMRYINCPNTIEQQNLQPVQYDRNMFYKTTRTIYPGEELFVYYGDEYARYLGIKPFSTDTTK